ncbi:MAG: glycerophosphodiester phosphodiesterase [Oscillospiraceae bacterium]|jgi:glycerophosphoryl diester phosphodiesterase|nr:glycerophosphodiester phosphodiesterase [Oscillospiraceae bacterium]
MPAFFVGLLLVLAIFLFYIWLIMPESGGRQKGSFLLGKNIAHRGLYNNSAGIPENSLEAARQSFLCGHGMEFDLQLSADGRIMVFHDRSLKRMTGVEKDVDELTCRELTDLSLLGTRQTLPTFEQYLEIAAGKIPLIIELKTCKNREDMQTLCSKTAELLDGYSGKFVIESFDPRIVAWFRKNRPQYIRGQLACIEGEEGQNLLSRFALAFLLLNFLGRPHFIAYEHTQFRNPSFLLCRAMGALTVGWTVADLDSYKKAQRIFDAIIFENILPANSYPKTAPAKIMLAVNQSEVAAKTVIHSPKHKKM